MTKRWKVIGLGVCSGIALATALMVATRPEPMDLTPAPVEVIGFAFFPEPLDPLVGGTLHVRLVDLSSPDSAGLLIANTTVLSGPRATSQGFSLRIPAKRARAAEDGYVVVSLTDHKGVRFIGSGFPREFKLQRAGEPVDLARMGFKLTAVPAP